MCLASDCQKHLLLAFLASAEGRYIVSTYSPRYRSSLALLRDCALLSRKIELRDPPSRNPHLSKHPSIQQPLELSISNDTCQTTKPASHSKICFHSGDCDLPALQERDAQFHDNRASEPLRNSIHRRTAKHSHLIFHLPTQQNRT